MTRARERFRRVPARYDANLPLIGVVGEIFCRLNTFSNDDLIRKLEGYGAEAWLSDIMRVDRLHQLPNRSANSSLRGRTWSLEMVKTLLRDHDPDWATSTPSSRPSTRTSSATKSRRSRKCSTWPSPICPSPGRWARWC